MKVKLIAITKYLDGRMEDLIIHAGLACRGTVRSPYMWSGDFIRARLRSGHESIIEHCSATFDISGISRACSHQLVRHRLASYSQESQRFVDMSNPEFVFPPSIEENTEATVVLSVLVGDAHKAYNALVKLGISKEDARFALPNAITTRIVMTMNFREYRHFIKVRADKAAQWEIRDLAKEILKQLYVECPSVFEDLYEEFIGTSC